MLCADFWRPYVVGTATYFDCDVTAQQPNGYAVNNDDGLPQDEAAQSRYNDEVEAAVAALLQHEAGYYRLNNPYYVYAVYFHISYFIYTC